MPAESATNPLAGARFLLSAASLAHLPDPDRPEVAFAGRSNAGKSSALNRLCGRRQLARVSKTPGRTQLLNFFELAQGRLVDLPGYGYAKVPQPLRREWGALVTGYIEQREALRGVVLIMDARHPLTAADRQLLEWVGSQELACHVLLTKADKLTRNVGLKTLQAVAAEVGDAASLQLFSSETGAGVEEARGVVQKFLVGE